MQVPNYPDLAIPLIKALQALGGSGSIAEIEEQVARELALPDEVLEIPCSSKANQHLNEYQYRLAWTRTYLKKYGLITNSKRGVWSLVPDHPEIDSFDPVAVFRTVQDNLTRIRRERLAQLEVHVADTSSTHTEGVGVGASSEESPEGILEQELAWRETLLRVLTEVLDPAGFERLIQRLLRESGFVQVEVTGRSGDGGIDGKGIAKLSGMLSFHVIFQCKKYQGSVSASQVRDFRGAMVGRADKGLLITTGSFTRDAIREATRDGAPPIDLVDGEELADRLKQLSLGVQTEMVERVTIDEEWFRRI